LLSCRWRLILTTRKRIAELLKKRDLTARGLSQVLRISEREVYDHLAHVERSLGSGVNLIVEPSRCLRCGFTFTKRKRFTAPGKCPVCRSESVSEPVYGITSDRNVDEPSQPVEDDSDT
jgi:transcriptional regulator